MTRKTHSKPVGCNKKTKMEITEDLRQLIEEQVDSKLNENKEIINEINKWKKWLKRIVLFIGITSIPGLLSLSIILNEVVDNRVAKRMQVLDNLNIAVRLAENGVWEKSLSMISTSWQDIKSGKFTINDGLKEYYFSNLLWILSSIEVSDSKNTQNGSFHWKKLQEDIDFQNYVLNQHKDPTLNINLAFCFLKFEQQVDSSLIKAEENLTLAKKHSVYLLEKSDLYYYLSIIEFIKGDKVKSKKLLKDATIIDPLNYSTSDLIKNYNSFKNSVTSDVWELAYVRKKKLTFSMENRDNFHAEYLKMLQEIINTTPNSRS